RMDRAASGLLDGDRKRSLSEYGRIRATGNRDAAAAYLLGPRDRKAASNHKDFYLWEISMMGHPLLKLQNREVGYSFRSVKESCSGSTIWHAGEMVKALSEPSLAGNYNLPEYEFVDRPPAGKKMMAAACAYAGTLNPLGCYSASNDLLQFVEYYGSNNGGG